jgi:hypothetical protein
MNETVATGSQVGDGARQSLDSMPGAGRKLQPFRRLLQQAHPCIIEGAELVDLATGEVGVGFTLPPLLLYPGAADACAYRG